MAVTEAAAGAVRGAQRALEARRNREALEQVAQLCDPAFEIEGCYLWPPEEAMARVGPQAAAISRSATAEGRWLGTATG